MTTNVPQDVIELAKQAGFDVDDDGDIWGSENGSLLRFAELLRAQRQQGAEPVAIVTVGANEHGPFSYRETPYGIDRLPEGETKLYTTPPQANALVVAAYRKAAEMAHAQGKDMADLGWVEEAEYFYNFGNTIEAAIPADAEAALRERDHAMCMRVARLVADEDDYIEPELEEIANSVLGEGGK
jgi:hypothetical protein